MYAEDFQFDNELASSYGLIICSFDGASGTTSIRNGADIELTTLRVPGSNVWNHINGRYNEVLSCTFQVAKKDCDRKDELEFSVVEQRAINRWLNRLDKFYPFKIIQDGYENIYYNAQINVNRIEIGGKVVGFEITVTTDKPYGYMAEQVVKFNVVENGKCQVVDISDDIGRKDVKMKITCKADGILRITNGLINENTSILNCVNGEVIEIDTRLKKITSSVRTPEILLKNFNFNFPQISNNFSTRINEIIFSLPAEGTISYYPIAKISF